MPGIVGGRPGLRRLLVSYFFAASLRCQASSVAGVTGKTSVQRLRELARDAGVRHAAPRRHFADRQALLDALAEAGFLRLGDELRAAIRTAGDDYKTRLRAAATAYIRFVTEDAALLELMYVVKRGQHSAELDDAFGRLFTTFDDLIRQGQQADELQPGDTDRVRLLLFAAIQGIAHSSPRAASTPGRPTNSSRTRSHYSPTALAKPVGAKNCLLIHPRPAAAPLTPGPPSSGQATTIWVRSRSRHRPATCRDHAGAP